MEQTELDKHAKTHDARWAINEFLEWLSKEGIELSKWKNINSGLNGTDRLMVLRKGRHELLDEYFNIDPAKLEKERRALLENARMDNKIL